MSGEYPAWLSAAGTRLEELLPMWDRERNSPNTHKTVGVSTSDIMEAGRADLEAAENVASTGSTPPTIMARPEKLLNRESRPSPPAGGRKQLRTVQSSMRPPTAAAARRGAAPSAVPVAGSTTRAASPVAGNTRRTTTAGSTRRAAPPSVAPVAATAGRDVPSHLRPTASTKQYKNTTEYNRRHNIPNGYGFTPREAKAHELSEIASRHQAGEGVKQVMNPLDEKYGEREVPKSEYQREFTAPSARPTKAAGLSTTPRGRVAAGPSEANNMERTTRQGRAINAIGRAQRDGASVREALNPLNEKYGKREVPTTEHRAAFRSESAPSARSTKAAGLSTVRGRERTGREIAKAHKAGEGAREAFNHETGRPSSIPTPPTRVPLAQRSGSAANIAASRAAANPRSPGASFQSKIPRAKAATQNGVPGVNRH